MRNLRRTALMLVACLALASCGSAPAEVAPDAADTQALETVTEEAAVSEGEAAEQQSEDLVIDAVSMETGDVQFVPFGSSGKAQIIVAKTSDGVVAKLDTCNSCNGAPHAYYESDNNGTIVCQNCGFDFAVDELDQRKGGCSPMDIAHEAVDDQVTIAAADLEAAEPLFSGIQR